MKIATWNVNSIRVRMPQVLAWLQQENPDILCLQETKITDGDFPATAFRNAGYQAVYSGQKAYNGVATISRTPAAEITLSMPGIDVVQKRILAVTMGSVRIVNVYVPNGDTVDSDKYAYKLGWLKALTAYLQEELKRYPKLVLLGDFNIAPEERDVHDPKRWEGKVLFSDKERAAFRALIASGLVDVFRCFEQPEKSFTWWDYRLNGFARNWGLRIDHILCSAALVAACRTCRIDVELRRAERPSDHALVMAEFSDVG
jgi:exodeoxyribonuclease-3